MLLATTSCAALGAVWFFVGGSSPTVLSPGLRAAHESPSAAGPLLPANRRSDNSTETSPVGGDPAGPLATRMSMGSTGWDRFDDDLRLAAAGCVRWFGVVLDRDGRPCPDAELWHASRPIGRSDAAGRFDLEVELPLPDEDFAGVADEHLAAWHPTAGSGLIEVPQRSAELTLRLEWNTLAAGTTVEAGTLRPLANAQLEVMAFAEEYAHNEPLFTFVGCSAAAGAWSFPGLPGTTLAMRARAEHHASAGWFSVGLPKRGDAPGLTFELMPLVTLRGWFTPWPPPGGLSSAEGASGARLIAQPLVKSDVRNAFERFELPLSADGSFAAEVPVSLDSELFLVVDDLLRWSRQVEFDGERREIDLGRIELDAGGFVDVVVDWPREVLELGLEVFGEPIGAAGFLHPRQALSPRGTARIGPFGARELQLSLCFSGGWNSWASKCVPPLADGEVRRWSPEELDAGELVCCGRVTTSEGRSVAGADVTLVVPVEGEVHQSGATTDRQGRYWINTGIDSRQGFVVRDRAIELRVRHLLGCANRFVDAELPAVSAIRRLDVELTARPPLRGTLLTADGQPAPVRWLVFQPLDGSTAGDAVHGVDCITDADGRFQLQPRGERRFRIQCAGPTQRWFELATVERSAEPLVLRLPASIEGLDRQ